MKNSLPIVTATKNEYPTEPEYIQYLNKAQLEEYQSLRETSDGIMPKGVEKVVVVLDLMHIASFPSLSKFQDLLEIFRDHYPERLFRLYILNSGTWPAQIANLSGFVPTETREKVKLVHSSSDEDDNLILAVQSYGGSCDLVSDIPEDTLLTEYGGRFEFEWDPECYWKVVSIL
ncbi:hypothetical protein HDV06_001400 [Boothiomyces sp. JEL0866]|nr:hypothetical protein HDV06_001400 [Boothiomyces sp. JEL0866]